MPGHQPARRCPDPRLDRVASHCLVTLAKRLNSKAKTVRFFEFCDYAVAITGRTGARRFCPFTITAHEIRAVLLAIATVTNRAGRCLRRPLTQSAPPPSLVRSATLTWRRRREAG